MFRLMSGIFANSLHGREFCFERLSACKCRSPRKSPPRDYVRKPPAVELGKSSPQKIRLWELMKQGCSCPKNSVKERWFSTNQHIILGLAKVLDRPPDAVSNFLYLLTLQNFSKIMNPGIASGNHCKVPLAYPNACEDYMRLFDTHGNIRSRFDHNSLMLLMRVMQAWLRRGAHGNFNPFDACLGAAHCTFRSGTKARKAGIGPDSIAHRNGRRRLRESDERACVIRSNLIGYPAKGCPRYLYGSGNDFSAAQGSPVTSGDPGNVFGMRFEPQDLNDWDQGDQLGGLSSYEDELAAERARRLEALLFQLNARTYLTRDAYFLIQAIKDIQVRRPRQKSARKSATDISSSKTISDSHYKMLRESEIRSRLKKNQLHDFGKDSSPDRYLLPSFGKDSSPDGQLLHAFGKNSSKQRHLIHDFGKDSSPDRYLLPSFGKDSSPEGQLLHALGKNSSQQRHLIHDFGKNSSQEGHRNRLSHRQKGLTSENQSVEDRDGGPTDKLYYGAPIPVLMHEPYSQDKPWTWLNRHPHQTRMNDRGSIVKDKNIRRYRRLTVVGQMEKARERGSVYSVYSHASATDVPMFGRRSDIKPATRKSLTRQSQVRQSLAPSKSGSNQQLVFSKINKANNGISKY